MSVRIGNVGPVRTIPAEALELEPPGERPGSHVDANRDGVELAAVPSVLTPGEAIAVVKVLVDAIHAVDYLELSAAQQAPRKRFDELSRANDACDLRECPIRGPHRHPRT